MTQLEVQYGENWEELKNEDSGEKYEDKKEIRFVLPDDVWWSSNDSMDNELEDNFAAQFEICFQGYLDTPNKIAICDEIGEVVPEILVYLKTAKRRAEEFHGASLDTRTTSSVCGLRQAEAYAAFAGFMGLKLLSSLANQT